jgi:hypothetical protein
MKKGCSISDDKLVFSVIVRPTLSLRSAVEVDREVGVKRSRDEVDEDVDENDRIHGDLSGCKDEITSVSPLSWDTAKMLTNEYEIVGHPIVSFKPISRSYFKLWEILHDYREEMMDHVAKVKVTAAFIAEGPGGFVECFVDYRRARSGPEDTLHCITLTPNGERGIPQWKLDSVMRRTTGLRVHRGSDGTGDLYRLCNLDDFVSCAGGSGTCHLVTADGGFDYSSDFNGQEDTSLRLIVCETYAALRLQKVGGCFVLKIFDIRCAETMAILSVLSTCYCRVHVVKPLTSRPANSEKYVVCTGFKGAPQGVTRALRSWIHSHPHDPFPHDLLPPISPDLVRGIVEYNRSYVARQKAAIRKALDRVAHTDNGPVEVSRSSYLELSKKQAEKSIAWCEHYGVKTDPKTVDSVMKPFVALGGGGSSGSPL